MSVSFVSSNDTGEIRTIFVWSDNEEFRLGNEEDDIIKGLLNSFWNNYQKEETILRNGSNFYLKVLIYCLIFFTKQAWKEENQTWNLLNG